MLFFWGGPDQHIPTEPRRAVTEALRAAGKPDVFSDADHRFNCDDRPVTGGALPARRVDPVCSNSRETCYRGPSSLGRIFAVFPCRYARAKKVRELQGTSLRGTIKILEIPTSQAGLRSSALPEVPSLALPESLCLCRKWLEPISLAWDFAMRHRRVRAAEERLK
jgi:hypothetical protein